MASNPPDVAAAFAAAAAVPATAAGDASKLASNALGDVAHASTAAKDNVVAHVGAAHASAVDAANTQAASAADAAHAQGSAALDAAHTQAASTVSAAHATAVDTANKQAASAVDAAHTSAVDAANQHAASAADAANAHAASAAAELDTAADSAAAAVGGLASAVSSPVQENGSAGPKKKRGFFAKLLKGSGSSSHSTPTPAAPAAPASPSSSAPAAVPAINVPAISAPAVAVAPETWTVHLSRVAGEPLGLRIRSDDLGVHVSEVVPDSVAAKAGRIASGNFLHKINDFVLTHAAHDDVLKALKTDELDLTFGSHPLPDRVAAFAAANAAAAAVSAAATNTTTNVANAATNTANAATDAAAKTSADASHAVHDVTASVNTNVSNVAAAAHTTATNAATQAASSVDAAAASLGASAAAALTPLSAGAAHEQVFAISRDAKGSLGMKLEESKLGGVIVSDVSKNSPAAKAGVTSGMLVAAVGDKRLDKASVKEVIAALGAAGSSFNLALAPAPPAPPKKSSKFGAFFGGKKSKKDVKAGEATGEEEAEAEEAPTLAGALSSTTAAVESAASGAAASVSAATQHAADSVAAAVPASSSASASAPAAPSVTRNVSLSRGSTGLGMKIKADEVSGLIHVTEVTAGGAADATKQLHVGDYLASINGVPTRHASQEVVVGALAKPTVDLVVVGKDDLPAYLKSLEENATATATATATSTFGAAGAAATGVGVAVSAAAADLGAASPPAHAGDKEEKSPSKRRFSLKFLDKLTGSSKKDAQSASDKATAAAGSPVAAATSAAASAAAAGESANKSVDAAHAGIAAAAAGAAGAVSAAAEDAEAVRKVRLVKGNEGLGMKIKSDDPKNGVCVYELTPGGVAEQSGKVQVGDIILEVNGNSVINMTHEQVVDELRRSKEVDLTLTKGFPAREIVRRDVSLSRTAAEGSHGLVLADALPGVKVAEISAGSSAERNGNVKVGDYILAVGSVVTLTHTATEVSQLLQAENVELTVSDQFPSEEFFAQSTAEDIKVQVQEEAVRHVHAAEADAAMEVEKAQRITHDKMANVQVELIRQRSKEEVIAAEVAEQARRVEAAEAPSAAVANLKEDVQQQFMSTVDRKVAAAAEEEEQGRRVAENNLHAVHEQLASVTDRKVAAELEHAEQERRVIENKMHDVQAQMLSVGDRKSAAALEAEEQSRRVAEGQHIPATAAALKHAVEVEVVQHVQHAHTAGAEASNSVSTAADNTQVGAALGGVAAAVAAPVAAAAAAADGVKFVTIDRGTNPVGLTIAGSKVVSVSSIASGSAAEKAGGIAVGDHIVEVDGKSFADASDSSNYDKVLQALKSAGPSVRIGYSTPVVERRKSKSFFSLSKKDKKDKTDSKEIAVPAAVAELPAAAVSAAVSAPATRSIVINRGPNGLGMRLHTDPTLLGVVSQVIPDSPAAGANVAVGDKIVTINGAPVEGKSSEDILQALRVGDSVNLVLQPVAPSPAPARPTSRFSIKSFISGGSKKNVEESAAAAAASVSPAATNTATHASNSATNATSGAAATISSPLAAAAATSDSEAQKEVQQLRFRVADLELAKVALEKRVQIVSAERDAALDQIRNLRSTVGAAADTSVSHA